MTDTQSIHRILVATDFSPTAEAGVDWAIELAKSLDARLTLVHGLTLPGPMTDFIPSPPDVSEALQEAASGRLNETAEWARSAGAEVETDLRLGLPSQAILEAARETKADIVVLGASGQTDLRHLLLGSTAERVVQHAQCPVLTVHPGDIDQHRQIRTILVPTDFSDDAGNAVEAALRLLAGQREGTRLVLLHAYHLPFEYTAYGAIPNSFDYYQDAEGAAKDSLEEIAAALRSEGLRIDTLARNGYPPEVIVAAAEEIEADLIALGTHGRSGLAHLLLGSNAERVVQHAKCPVLTVRRVERE